MDDPGSRHTPPEASGTVQAADASSELEPVAVYGLEQPVRCPFCRQEIEQLFVIRLYRARVDFVSSLPRSGRLLVCPRCRTPIPGELGAVF